MLEITIRDFPNFGLRFVAPDNISASYFSNPGTTLGKRTSSQRQIFKFEDGQNPRYINVVKHSGLKQFEFDSFIADGLTAFGLIKGLLKLFSLDYLQFSLDDIGKNQIWNVNYVKFKFVKLV